MNELQEQAEMIVETAVNEYPMAPLPTHFVTRVMARIAVVPQWRPEPFRISWRDLLLPGGTTIFTYFLISLTLWLLGRDVAWLPTSPALLPFTLDSLINIGWLSIAIMVILGEIGLLLLVGLGLWWDRPLTVISEPSGEK